MLTKWGAALGLASAGRVVAGGGGVLGDATVWPAVLDWTALGTIAGPLRVDDFAPVSDLQPGSGLAIYDGTDWRLYQAVFATVADLLAFGQLKLVGAIATVGTGIETDPAYYYTGSAWERMADGVPFAWTLSSITNIDPSGVGATQAGDFGLLNGRLYRLTVPLALPGGGTAAYWVTPEVYAGTVTVGAYLVGTEVVSNDTALNAQGWPTVTRTNGAITSQTTRVRLATSAASGVVAISALTSGVTATTKVYLRFLMRAVVGNGSTTNVTTVGIPAFGDGSNFLVGAYLSADVAKGTFFWTGSATNSSGFDKASQAAVPGLSSADDLVEVIINTTAGVRTCEMWRNGIMVSTSNVVVGAFADQVTLRATSGSTATQTATLEVSQAVVMTWV